MTTYRHELDGGGVGHAALPETGGTTVGRGVLTAPPGDTTWLYDEASGVMTNKLYADGKVLCRLMKGQPCAVWGHAWQLVV